MGTATQADPQGCKEAFIQQYNSALMAESSLRKALTEAVQRDESGGHGLLSDRELQELNSQMIAATAATAEGQGAA
jgi:hypothetical protein